MQSPELSPMNPRPVRVTPGSQVHPKNRVLRPRSPERKTGRAQYFCLFSSSRTISLMDSPYLGVEHTALKRALHLRLPRASTVLSPGPSRTPFEMSGFLWGAGGLADIPLADRLILRDFVESTLDRGGKKLLYPRVTEKRGSTWKTNAFGRST